MAACVCAAPAPTWQSSVYGDLQASRTPDLCSEAYQASLSKRIRSTFSDFSLFSAATKQQQTIAVQASCSQSSRPAPPPRAPVWSGLPASGMPARMEQQLQQQQQPSTSQRCGVACDLEFLHQCLQDEYKSAANPHYLTIVQRDFNSHKRLVLVDWMIEVVDEFRLRQETLFLAVNVLDRYLSLQPVARGDLQLVGITALWLACKYEEVYPPVLADFVEITDHAYSGAQLIAMESRMLTALHFQLAVPTAIGFLHQLLAAHAQEGSDERGAAAGNKPAPSPCASSPASPSDWLNNGAGFGSSNGSSRSSYFSAIPAHTAALSPGHGRRLVHLAEYLLELALLNPECMRWRPSVLAAAALRTARAELSVAGPDPLTDQVVASVAADVTAATAEMLHMAAWAAAAASKPPMVFTKYSLSGRSHVALIMAQCLQAWRPA